MGVNLMVRRLSTGTDLKIFLLDIAKAELGADLVKTYELLIEQSTGTPGAEPWSVLAGSYTFDLSAEDLALLARMAAVARHAGAPFLGAASPRVLGCESLAETPEPRNWKPHADVEGEAAWLALR